MADGTKVVRIWDASAYPAHALYVGGTWVDENEFDEGDEWITQGPASEHKAFTQFSKEAQFPGYTPFDQAGSFLYRRLISAGDSPYPIAEYLESGDSLDADSVTNSESTPQFPPNIDNPI
jgi:hypothetical protein